MRIERIDESVKVRADFEAGRVQPLLVRRGTLVWRVVRVHGRWSQRQGSCINHCFSVGADDGNVYQLRFDAGALTWVLEAVDVDG